VTVSNRRPWEVAASREGVGGGQVSKLRKSRRRGIVLAGAQDGTCHMGRNLVRLGVGEVGRRGKECQTSIEHYNVTVERRRPYDREKDA